MASTKVGLADASWSIPLILYKLSGRRLARSPQLYRAGVLRQRLVSRHLPGMTTVTERAYFKWHAQEIFGGRGAIVDLGSWFGSTTAALAMGLCANSHPAAQRAVIHAFDRFTWEPWMDSYAHAARFGSYSPGDTFLGEFEVVTRPWRHRIEVHGGDLLNQTWDDRPIEVLLIDAMKSWELAQHILIHFCGALMKDHGYLIHQDFSNCFTSWIPLVTYRLRNFLEPVQSVPRSETMVFRVVRLLEEHPDLLGMTRSSFDDMEVNEAFDFALRITDAEKHSGINAARAMLLVYDGDLAGAKERVDMLDRMGKLSEFHHAAVLGAIDRAEQPTGANGL